MADDRRALLKQAFELILRAAGERPEADFAETPERATELWDHYLLAGVGTDLRRVLGETIAGPKHGQPVSLVDIDIQLVCPHHLTIAFGHAHVAYLPAGKIVGFGALTRLVERATARLVLQEAATADIATTLVEALDARAAVAAIEAKHPCHNVTEKNAHASRALTWAYGGAEDAALELKELILAAIGERQR